MEVKLVLFIFSITAMVTFQFVSLEKMAPILSYSRNEEVTCSKILSGEFEYLFKFVFIIY
jgi:hypothetical protein